MATAAIGDVLSRVRCSSEWPYTIKTNLKTWI